MSLSMDELAEALREITYEHGIFFRRIKELTELLEKEPSEATRELIRFMKDVVLPHRAKEEAQVFPVILKLKPTEESLIKELIEEHRKVENSYQYLQGLKFENVDLAENIRLVKDNLNSLKDHISKEAPLYQLLLNEATKK